MDWRPFFPFAEPRPEQVRAIEFALDAFLNQGKRFCVLGLGTGVGKSAIGVTVARCLDSLEGGGTYFLTSQNLLAKQYVRDFGRIGMRDLKSADNYSCTQGFACSTTKRLMKVLKRGAACSSECPYNADKKAFIEASLGVTNYAYFMNETTYAGALEPRNLLVLDECHNVEETLSKFASVDVSDQINRSVAGRARIKIPFGTDQERAFEWIKGEYREVLGRAKAKLQRDIARGKAGELAERYERIDKHLCRVNRFVERYRPDDWLLCESDDKSGRALSFRPLRVAGISRESLLDRGKRVLMMSASILDIGTFCRWLGLDPDEVAYLEIDCPFPVSNRVIHYLPVGKMSKDDIDSTLPKMVEALKSLLELHEGERGIVHAGSHRIARFVRDSLRSPRLVYSDDRDAMLREQALKQDGVLLSPSMTEGVDLVDDLSRFQIFLKVPYPFLGDRLVAKKLELDRRWYDLCTARTMVQGHGRSIRNAEDSAVSYILDSSWEFFFKRNYDLFPPSFREALALGNRTR